MTEDTERELQEDLAKHLEKQFVLETERFTITGISDREKIRVSLYERGYSHLMREIFTYMTERGFALSKGITGEPSQLYFESKKEDIVALTLTSQGKEMYISIQQLRKY